MNKIKSILNNIDWKIVLSKIRHIFTRHVPLKLLSLLLALLLWNYVITSNPNITRNKSISDIEITMTGQSVLSSRNLALLSDPTSDFGTARVTLSVSQANFSLPTAENVRVVLDLTSIKSSGQQRVELQGTSVYGDVVQIWPEYIDVYVEELVQRNVPINVTLTGTDSAYWYSTVVNPTQLSVSGPASVVQNVASAEILLDVSGITSYAAKSMQFVLVDQSGEEISRSLTYSTSSVMVYVDPYPTKSVEISKSTADIFSGTLPVGHEITSFSISPETVTIAGESALLEGINKISFNKIDISNKTASFTRTLNLSSLSGVKYISSSQVTVNVVISEIETTRKFDNIPITAINLPEGATIDTTGASVLITGPYTQVESIISDDIITTIDAEGLTKGNYDLPISVTVNGNPGLTCTSTPFTVNVTIP